MSAVPLTESQVRALRDRVYGHPQYSTPESREKNWNECKAKWMQPEETAWLQSQIVN